jgi:hypothetical protein
MEAFLARLMEENPTPCDVMDDEYYLFTGEGTTACLSMYKIIDKI